MVFASTGSRRSVRLVVASGLALTAAPLVARADHCIYVRIPKFDHFCQGNQPAYGYPSTIYSCDDQSTSPCTGEPLWFSESIPIGSCNNPWSGIAIECDAKVEPKNDRDPAGSCVDRVGDPVDVTTGIVEQNDVDIDLGHGLRFSRHYASRGGYPSNSDTTTSMGHRWQHSLDWSIEHHTGLSGTQAEIYIVHRALATPVAFLRISPTDPWTGGLQHGYGSIAVDSNGNATFVDTDGTSVQFNNAGQLTSIKPPQEPAIAVTSGTNNTTYSNGSASLVLSYFDSGANAGRIQTVSMGGGGPTWTYGYDATTQNLTSASGPDPSNPGASISWAYSYDSNASLLEVDRTAGGNTVTTGRWTYSGTTVASASESALDQDLNFALSVSSGTPIQMAVKDSQSTPLATYALNRGFITGVTNAGGTLGGAAVDVPFLSATFTADSNGNNTGLWQDVADENHHITHYESYDQSRPQAVKEGCQDVNQNGIYAAGAPCARTRNFTYHPALDHPLTVTEASTISGAFDHTTTYDYGTPATSLLNHIRVHGKTLGADGNPVSFDDTTDFTYNGSGQVTSITGPGAKQYTEIDYDAATGSRSAVRRYLNGQGSSYLQWTFSNFDSRGNPQTVTDPNQRVTSFAYDGLNRVKSVTPPYEGTGSTTISFTYDADGNLTRVDFPPDTGGNSVFLRMGYDAKRHLTFLADSQANAIVYEYNGTYLNSANQHVTNGQERPTREARYTGFASLDSRGTLMGDSTFDYNIVGRLVRAYSPLFGGNIYSQFTSDAKGNPTGITDENGRTDNLGYDALDRLTQIQQVRSATYTTSFTYDPLSNVSSVTDAASKTTDTLHDDRGHLVRTISPDTGTTLFLYDAAGNLTQKIEAFGTSASRSTSYTYDGLNRLTGITYPPSDSSWTFTYDTDASKNQKSRLALVTNGIVQTKLDYTQRGDVAAERTVVDGLTYSVTYTYDAAGNRHSIVGPDGAEVDTPYAGLRPSTLSVSLANNLYYVKNLAFYPFGPRIHAEFPNGSANTVFSDRQVNLRGQVTEVSLTGSAETIFLDRVYAYDYTAGTPGPNDPGPNLDQVTDYVDSSQSRFYFYDELDRLQKASDLSGNALFQYGYDAVGNRTSQVSAAGATSYSYESGTDRLAASAGATALDYAHDAFGNRIYQGSAAYAGTPSLLYNESNRLVQAKDPANSFAVLGTYTYDAFGRRIKKVTPTQTFVYLYDSAGHLVEEVEKKSGTDHARDYVYVEDELVGLIDYDVEVGATSGLTPPWRSPDAKPPIWVLGVIALGAAGLLVAARKRPAVAAAATSGLALVFLCAGAPRPKPVFSWVHTDPLGTPLAVTNSASSAAVIWRASYEPFGMATVDQDPDGDGIAFVLNVRFPGQYFDTETGLHYNIRRDYDPATGRYLESEPIASLLLSTPAALLVQVGPHGYDTAVGRWNLYSYALGEPTLLADPTGMSSIHVPVAPLSRNVSITLGSPNVSSEGLTFDKSAGTATLFDDEGRPVAQVPAISGPWPRGPLPDGTYETTGRPAVVPPTNPLQGSYCDPVGNCWWWPISPQFPTDRNGLGIHPDGGVPGTRGCIGLEGSTTDFYHKALERGPRIPVLVLP